MTSRIFQFFFAIAVAGATCMSLAAPANDDMADAVQISGSSGSTGGSNVGATSESGEPILRHSLGLTTTIWWRWTAPTSGRVVFDTVGSSFDTVMGVYAGTSLSSLEEIDYDDDGGGNLASRCVADCTPGETYYICVAGWNGASGDASLQWEVRVPLQNLSRFRIDGYQAVVCGVVGATADSFTSTDGFGNPRCLVDSRIVDAEKTSGWNDDTYWCTALSEMDMLVWLGWSQDAGYADVDAFADHFRDNPGLLRTKPDNQGERPVNGTYWGSAFNWYEDNIGELQCAGVDFSFAKLSAAIDLGDGLMRINVSCDCTSQPWAGLTGQISHALVCCGYAYDDSLPKSDPNSLKGIFVIDSDNDQETNGGAGSAPNSISYRSVTWNAGCECYEVASVWGGRDGTISPWESCMVLYAKPGYEPIGVDVSGGGGNPQPDPQPDPQPAELVFGAGQVSTFETGDGTATVAGVENLTWEKFSDYDHFGTTCFADARIVDAEKDAARNNDDFWCGAMTDIDMMFALGWLSGFRTVDEVVGRFQKNGENDIRWADDPSTFDPTRSSSFDTLHEGQYGYRNEAYYTGLFRWAQDAAGASGITDHVAAGTVDSGFLQVLRAAFPNKRLRLGINFPETNSHPFWSGCVGGVGHFVLCCGYVSSGLSGADALKGLFIIDSDNDQYASGGGASAPNSIAYCPVTWDAATSSYRIRGVWGEHGTIDRQYVALERRQSATQVADPVLDPPSNMTFTASLEVKCTCPTVGATIRVTTNDTEVTESSPTWTNLTLTATTVVRVKAFKTGMTASNEVKFTYTREESDDDDRDSSLWTDPVVKVGKKDELEATSATSYTGWLHDAKGNLTGSFTMKVGKANKNGIAKATLTVTDLATGLKSKYTGNYSVEDGAFEDGQLEDLEVGANGVVGKIGKETLTGGRTADKQEAQSIDSVYKNRIFAFAFQNTAGKNVKGAATFTAKFSSKGKAKISGTLMDGTKVSTSAQLIVGDKACALPVAFSKKGKANFGLVLWFNEKKATFKEATGLTECTLGDGATDVKVEFVGCAEVDGSLPKVKALEVDGKKVAELSSNGKKWVATAAKGFEDAKPKVTYAAKKGTLTGSYKATVKGATKPVSAKITGVWLGKTGVGTAVMKVNKVTTALPVVVK